LTEGRIRITQHSQQPIFTLKKGTVHFRKTNFFAQKKGTGYFSIG